MTDFLRKLYRKYIHWPWLDQRIYSILDLLTNIYSNFKGYSFPSNYIRRWKLNMLFNLYEESAVDLFKKIIKPGMTIVDIGAHIGYFTRIFAEQTGPKGTIYAFEADPENFQLLGKNTRRFKNIKNYQLAITDHPGTIDFYHYDEKSGCNSILPNIPLNFKKQKISVAANDLDSFLKKENINQVDIVKMDIEGGESKALAGMQNTIKNNKNIQMILEFAPAWIEAAGDNPNTFLGNLESWGFKVFAIQNNKLVKIGKRGVDFLNLLPINPTHHNEFLNLYCVKGNRIIE